MSRFTFLTSVRAPVARFLLALAVAGSASCAHAADLVETARADGTLKVFLAALEASGFTRTLKNTGPYTVFAPSDEAFKKLPSGTVDALLKDKARLARLLAHHIIPGRVMVADIKPGPVKTLEGDTLTLKSDNGLVTAENASVILSDIKADNGVIHEVDSVMLEP